MWSLSGPVCSSITSHRLFCHEAELLCQQTWAVTLNQWYIHLGLWISKFREHWNPWEGLWKYRALGATLRICLVWGMYNSNQSPRAAHAGLHFDNHWPKKIPCVWHLLADSQQPPPSLGCLSFYLNFNKQLTHLQTRPVEKRVRMSASNPHGPPRQLCPHLFVLHKNALTVCVRKPVGNALNFLYQYVSVNERRVILTLKQALLVHSVLERRGGICVWNPNSSFTVHTRMYTHMYLGTHTHPTKFTSCKYKKTVKWLESEINQVSQKASKTQVPGQLSAHCKCIVVWHALISVFRLLASTWVPGKAALQRRQWRLLRIRPSSVMRVCFLMGHFNSHTGSFNKKPDEAVSYVLAISYNSTLAGVTRVLLSLVKEGEKAKDMII